MAENWYVLKVRTGFEKTVTRALRRRGFKVVLPEDVHHSASSTDCVYCRFAPKDKVSVTAVPGVLDVIQQIASPLKSDPSLC